MHQDCFNLWSTRQQGPLTSRWRPRQPADYGASNKCAVACSDPAFPISNGSATVGAQQWRSRCERARFRVRRAACGLLLSSLGPVVGCVMDDGALRLAHERRQRKQTCLPSHLHLFRVYEGQLTTQAAVAIDRQRTRVYTASTTSSGQSTRLQSAPIAGHITSWPWPRRSSSSWAGGRVGGRDIKQTHTGTHRRMHAHIQTLAGALALGVLALGVLALGALAFLGVA
jgi:hypothetical protein